MKNFLLRHWLKIAGLAAGALGGYLYYYYIGCIGGTCPITSNPYKMIFFGAILGYLLFDIFSVNKSQGKMMETTEEINNSNKDSDV